MLKYDHQLTEVKTRLPAANRVLIVLPQNLNTDNLAAGLALFLSLKNTGKKVDIVSTGTPLVSQSNLYGIGEIKNNVSKSGAGNFIVSLDGVVDITGTMQKVPSLETVDWYPEGNKLNVVFHVVPGQRFEPTNITWSHDQAGYDLTVVIGCQNLNELGNLFISNSQYFAQSQVVNIDTNPLNSYFGFSNVVDPQASSLSEIVAHILPSLTLNMDSDGASNIIAGIYFATNNLTQKVNPDTFLAVSQSVQVGGSLPNISPKTSVPEAKIDFGQAEVQPEPQIAQQIQQQPQPDIQPQPEVQPQAQIFPAQESISPSLQSSPFIVPPQDIVMPPPQMQFNQPVMDQSAQTVQSVSIPEMNFPAAKLTGYPTESSSVNHSSPNQDAMNSGSGINSVHIESGTNISQGNSQGFDLRQIFQIPQMPSGAVPANPEPQASGANPSGNQVSSQLQPQSQYSGGKPENHIEQPPQIFASPEEKPTGETVQSQSPEIESSPTPDWLVPKIFKGGNMG